MAGKSFVSDEDGLRALAHAVMIVDTPADQEVLIDKAMAGEIGEAEEMIEKGNRIQEKVKVPLIVFCGFVSFPESIEQTLTLFNPFSKYYEYFVENWLYAIFHYSLVVVPAVLYLSWVAYQLLVSCPGNI